MDGRLAAPIWRHDGYTLRALRRAVDDAIGRLGAAGVLGPARGVVVDLGSGDAPYRPLFAGRSAAYIACDIAPGPSVDELFEPGRPTRLAAGSADVVASFQVLEHVWDLDAYLGECRRLLAPDGRLLLTTHGTWLYHPHPTDFRRWTREGLCRELEARGFVVAAIEPVVGPLAWTTQFRLLGWNHVLSRLGPAGSASAAVLNAVTYLRMKLEDAFTPAAMVADNASVYVVVASPKARETTY